MSDLMTVYYLHDYLDITDTAHRDRHDSEFQNDSLD